MTLRAILIGLVLGLVLACFGYFNDWVMNQTYLAADLVPVSVYGLLVLGLLLINPLLRGVKWLRFKASEWCVIASLMLMAAIIPGPGLMWYFTANLALPSFNENIKKSWQDQQLLDYAPPNMLVRPMNHPPQPHEQDLSPDALKNRRFQEVIINFKSGTGQIRRLGFAELPWYAWVGPLSFWMPFIALTFIAGIAMVLVIHHQWVHRERLRYPVADLASELIEGSGQGFLPRIFKNRIFWIGLGLVLLIHLINGIQSWYPNFINVPLTIDLNILGKKWPIFYEMPNSRAMRYPCFFFTAIGLAYFVSTQISLSVGISNYVWGLAFVAVTTFTSVNLSSGWLEGGAENSLRFGAYLGMAIMIFYIGRRFYWDVLRAAFFIPIRDPIQGHVVWAMRLVLLCTVAMIVLLITVTGLHWLLAILIVMLTGMMFLVMTRIHVETGLFFIQPIWQGAAVLVGLFGIAALGPNMFIILAMLSVVLTLDPRTTLMPLAATAMRFSESHDIRPARLSVWLIVAVILALVVGVFATLWIQYNYGGGVYDWANVAARFPFEYLQKELRHAEQFQPGQWYNFDITKMQIDPSFAWSALIGVGLVLACTAMRLRFHRWPIHPVLFLVWGTFATGMLAPSFLVGWACKVITMRFGGIRTYRRFKPFFIGMIAGEFLAAIFWVLVALAYFAVTGIYGKSYRVFP